MDSTISHGRHKIHHSKLSGSEFHDVCLKDATFDDVNLSSGQFSNVNLEGACFSDVNLSEVRISNGNYDGMKVEGIFVSNLLAFYSENK